MAEAPDALDKSLEELQKEITCPVCQEHFRDPKILPCLHYYCKECVRQLARRAGPDSPFACPECRRETVLPQNDPDQLPTAFFVNRMKELGARMEKAHGKVDAVCEMCSGAKAEAFCRQCTEFICSECVRSHGKMKVFAGHNVVSLHDLKEGGTKVIRVKEDPLPMCTDHREQLKIFCYDCNCLICRDCIICDHASHVFEYVNKSAPRYKTTLKESLASLVKIQNNISTATREIEKIEREVSAQQEAVAGTIEQSFKQLEEILHRRKKQLVDTTSEVKQQKLDNLGVQKKGFSLAISEIQTLVEFVERSIENATDEEFMLLQQRIQDQIQEQYKKHKCIDLIPTEVADIGVRVACGEDISDLCQKNAEVIVLPADPTKCTAEGAGTEVAEVGESSQFTVQTWCQNGQPCREKQVVEAELKSVVNDSVVHAKVTSKWREVYEVSYTPEVRGRHTLIVKVNGTQISGSPFRVFAKIHPTQLDKPVRIIKGFRCPWGIAFNSKQWLVVAERFAKRVTVFDKDGNKLQTITCDKFSSITGVAVDKDDNIYVSDIGTWANNSSIFKFSKGGELIDAVGSKGKRVIKFKTVAFIKIIGDRLYACDCGNKTIQILNTELECVASFGSYGTEDGQLNRRFLFTPREANFHYQWFIPNNPIDIAQDGTGNLYVTDNHRVQVFDRNGVFSFAFSSKGTASKLNGPCGICVGPDQFVYMTELGSRCVSVFNTSGEFVTSFGQFFNPFGIAIDEDGFVYVSCANVGFSHRVYIL